MKIRFERKKTILLALSGLVLLGVGLVGGGVWLAQPLIARAGVEAALERAGFLDPRIASVRRDPRGGMVFEDIRLDREGFSTIGQMRLIPAPPGGPPGRSLMIDHLVLTMGWSDLSGASTNSGWVRPASLRGLMDALARQDIRTLTLNSGQLDVALPLLGLIRLEGKGQATIQDAIRLQSTLWTTQHALSMELRLGGDIIPGGMASIDAEIHSGKITLPHLSATRLGGWAIVNRDDATAPWQISAQIVAGMMQAFHIPINSLTLTAEGTSDELNLNLQGGGRESDRTALSMESILRARGDDHMAMALRIDDRDSIIRYLNGAVTMHDLGGDREWMRGALRKAPDAQGANDYELDLHNAEAGRLAAFIGLSPPLEITGTLGGLLKLRRDERGMLRIDHGMLRNHRGGTIASGLNTLPDAIRTGEGNRDEAARLLQSLRYDSIEIFVDGTVQDSVRGDITINGRDPHDGETVLKMDYSISY